MTESIVAEPQNDYQPNYKKRKYQIEDLIGKRFGRLTIIGEVSPYCDPSGQTCRKMLLQCDCGNTSEALLKCLKRDSTRSCGCLREEVSIRNHRTHNCSKNPLYYMWTNMNRRCGGIKYDRFKDWGGRGISVCDEWRGNPIAFIAWAEANGWKKGLILDRQENDDGYSPQNCRFVDPGTSARNTRLLYTSNASKFCGVSFYKQRNKWVAGIISDNKHYFLGYFSTPGEAALARDKKAIELNAGHPLNFPLKGEK